MTPHAKPRRQRLILGCIVVLAILLLLLRLFVFTHGHVRRGGRADSQVVLATARPATASTALAWTDRFDDGTPDFLRLTDPADQAAFRQWFTLIAEFQAIRPRPETPAEIADCASLLRYSYR